MDIVDDIASLLALGLFCTSVVLWFDIAARVV